MCLNGPKSLRWSWYLPRKVFKKFQNYRQLLNFLEVCNQFKSIFTWSITVPSFITVNIPITNFWVSLSDQMNSLRRGYSEMIWKKSILKSVTTLTTAENIYYGVLLVVKLKISAASGLFTTVRMYSKNFTYTER